MVGAETQEAIDPNLESCVAETQNLLASLITQPPISQQLLARPPVKFLRDVFVEVSATTGCGVGVVSLEDLEQMASTRDKKIAFLTMLLHFVAIAADEPTLLSQVRVGKMAAGLEPEKTNLLLRRLHYAATTETLRDRWGHAGRIARKAWESSLAALSARSKTPKLQNGGGEGATASANGGLPPLTGARDKDRGDCATGATTHENAEDGDSKRINRRPGKDPSITNNSKSQAQLQEWAKFQPTPSEIESWVKRLLSEGLGGLDDGRLFKLSTHTARLEKIVRELMECFREEGYLTTTFTEWKFWRMAFCYIQPLFQQAHSVASTYEKCSCGNIFLVDEEFCRKCGMLRPRPPEKTTENDGAPKATAAGDEGNSIRNTVSLPGKVPEPPETEKVQSTQSSPMMSKRQFIRQSVTAKMHSQIEQRMLESLQGSPGYHFVSLLNEKCGTELIDAVEKLMTDEPFDLNQPIESSGAYPIHYAVAYVKNPGLVKLIVNFRADVRSTYQGVTDWFGVQPGQSALEYSAMKKKDHKSEKWDIIEELLKSELDRLRGWDTGRRMTRALTYTKSQLAELSNNLSESSENSDYDMECQKEKCKQQTTRRGSAENSRALYETKAGFCEHIEGHPSTVYDLEDKVGEGSFGCVRKGIHKQSGSEHAIKSLPKMLIEDLSLWSEIGIMRQIDHPHIMKLYSTFEDNHNVFMVCELCTGGQLFDAIIVEGAISERICAILMKQMLAAVSYLHLHKICHRDLKPENFMLANKNHLEDAHVKMIDFGTAKRFDLEPMKTRVCTVHYVAPELLKNQLVTYTEKCDIWSCGVILYVMLCGSPPFNGETDMEVLQKVKKGKYTYKPTAVWESISDDVQRMIKKMLTVKAKDRYSAEAAARDSWVLELAPNALGQSVASQAVLGKMRAFHAFNKLKKVALQVIAQQLSDDSLKQLREVFLSMDKGMTGALSVDEMIKVIKTSGFDDKTHFELVDMIVEMAGDSKEINYNQFLAANIDRQVYLREEACKAAFKLFDVDGDGVISRTDLSLLFGDSEKKSSVLDAKGEVDEVARIRSKVEDEKTRIAGEAMNMLEIKRQEIERIMNESDQDGDGHIDFEEFKAMLAAKSLHLETEFGSEQTVPMQGPTKENALAFSSEVEDTKKTEAKKAEAKKAAAAKSFSTLKKSPTVMLEKVEEKAAAAIEKRRRSLENYNQEVDAEELKNMRNNLVSDSQKPSSSKKDTQDTQGTQGTPMQSESAREVNQEKHEKEEKDDKATKEQANDAAAAPMVRSKTLLFGKRGNRKAGNTDVQNLGGPSDKAADQKEAQVTDAKRGSRKSMSGRPDDFYAEMKGPNPLWEILQLKHIDMDKLKECLLDEGVKYVNTPLMRDEGVPEALFLAVSLRSPEMVKLLLTFRSDVRKRHGLSKPWKGVKVGQTAIEYNDKQKSRYVGTVLFDRCEAIDSLMKAEEDRLRGWRNGRRASTAARRYFEQEEDDRAHGRATNRLSVEDAEKEAENILAKLEDKEEMTPEEAILMKITLYSSEATFIVPHVTGDPREVFDMGDLCGEGTFGVVRKGVDKDTGLEYAVKTVPKTLLEESDLWQEIDLMRDMDHPYVTRLFGTFEDDSNLYMIMENCRGGELFEAVERARGFTESTSKIVFYQMLVAIGYIHNKEICHRDVKPENFLLSSDGPVEEAIVKLIDFGTARRFGPDSPLTTKVCTIHYVAPEILARNEAPYNEKVDCWSLGVCLFLMLSGSPPFSGENDTVVLKKVRKGKFKFEPEAFWSGISTNGKDLISSLLQVEPSDRLSAQEAVDRPWLQRRRESIGDLVSPTTLKQVIPKINSFKRLSWFQRSSMRLVTNQLSAGIVEDMRDLWFAMDKGNKGKLEPKDIAVALTDVAKGDKELEAELRGVLEFMEKADPGAHASTFSYTSFLAANLDKERLLHAGCSKAAFNLLDLDGDGKIGLAELGIVLQAVQMHDQTGGDFQLENIVKVAQKADDWVMKESERIIDLFDEDGNKVLEYPEFKLMLQLESSAEPRQDAT